MEVVEIVNGETVDTICRPRGLVAQVLVEDLKTGAEGWTR
jgi:hypothetical protein